jgi:predicted alpha/beta-fold hydrolase
LAAFKPAWWLPGRHLQTLWPALMRRGKKLLLRRDRIELADGDFIDIDCTQQTTGPIVIVLHGLEGSVNSSYAQGLLAMLSQHGWRSGVMHFRGCSGEMNRLPRIYHSGETSDVATIVDILHQREPQTSLVVVGFSLGGNVLLKWLGETKTQNPLVAAVAISVPFELGKAADYMRQGFTRVYHQQLLRLLQKKIAAKFQSQTAPIMTLPALSKLQTIREFDDKITAPLHGFASAEDYYVRSSSRQFLKNIGVPTLIINALDDPFVPEVTIPAAEELSSYVELEITKQGGHVGFVAGSLPWQPQYWLEQRIVSFIAKFSVIATKLA